MSLALGILASLALQQPAGAKPVAVPFKVADDAILVDTRINGRLFSMMFDTGFSGTAVLGTQFDLGKASGRMMLRDFVGEFEARTVAVTSFQMGSLNLRTEDLEIVQKPMDHMSFSYNAHTDGILGFEIARDHVFEINFEKKQFVFHPRSFDITKRKPDNKRTFLARMLPMGVDSVEMEVLTKDGKRLVLALDTGNAFYATTHKDVLQRVGLWNADQDVNFMRTAWVASGPVDSWYKLMRDLTIYGVPVKESVWSIIDLPGSSADKDGTIGFGFLKNFNIIIDTERRRVWLENWTGEVGNPVVGDVGISAGYVPDQGRVLVWRVTPGSPADKAGLRRGDAILDIDGTDVVKQDFRTINRMLEGTVGSKVRLAVSRQGNLMRHELERKPLINGMPAPAGQ